MAGVRDSFGGGLDVSGDGGVTIAIVALAFTLASVIISRNFELYAGGP